MQTEAVRPEQLAQAGRERLIRGLYAVTPDCPDTALLCALVEKALAGGASAVQYRNKTATAGLKLEQAKRLADLCRRHGVPLIVNDDPALAAQAGAGGVHLGVEDGPIEAARACVGPTKIIGVSCYNDLHRAVEAQALGADYVAFGSFFASAVKPGAVRPSVGLLPQAKSVLTIPVVAIGGIDEENAPQLVRAGADAIAVISALFAVQNVQGAAERLSSLFAINHENQPKAL